MTTHVLPDVEVDESELTAQPCRVAIVGNPRCGRASIGEVVTRCDNGCSWTSPRCASHMGADTPRLFCRGCRQDGHPNVALRVIASRYYTRPAR